MPKALQPLASGWRPGGGPVPARLTWGRVEGGFKGELQSGKAGGPRVSPSPGHFGGRSMLFFPHPADGSCAHLCRLLAAFMGTGWGLSLPVELVREEGGWCWSWQEARGRRDGGVRPSTDQWERGLPWPGSCSQLLPAVPAVRHALLGDSHPCSWKRRFPSVPPWPRLLGGLGKFGER